MKIAQVTAYYDPFMIGGVEWYVRNISTGLVKAGHEVTVFTASEYRGQKAPVKEVLEGVTVRRFPLKIDLTYRLKLWNGLRAAIAGDDFDVIHTYDYAQMHSIDALKAAEARLVPAALTVFDVHSVIPRVWYKRFAMKYLDSYFARATLPLATLILVRAESLVQDLPELGGGLNKVRVSPSGVRDESFGSFSGDKFREKHSVSGSPLVLFVGRLNPLKGPQFLIEAASSIIKDFPGIAFVFVGPDQSGYKAELQKMASRLGIASHVRFTGMISDFEEKMQAYSACDVFVLPTSYEGTSQAIFEAMSQGKPVVATKTGGIASQVDEEENGLLVEYGDAASLSAAIRMILRDDAMRGNMSRNALAKADGFRYSKLVKSLLSNYQEMLQNGN